MSNFQQTLTQLRDLRLISMADALARQMEQPRLHDLGFEERLSLLVDFEWTERQSRKLKRLISSAGLPEAANLEPWTSGQRAVLTNHRWLRWEAVIGFDANRTSSSWGLLGQVRLGWHALSPIRPVGPNSWSSSTRPATYSPTSTLQCLMGHFRS